MRSLNLLLLFLGLPIFSFSQTIEYTVPAGYENKIGRDDYKKIVDRSVADISKRYAINNVKEGTIYLEKNGELQAFNLDNLIDECLAIKDRSQWNLAIDGHFKNIFSAIDEQKKIDPKNFKSIKKYLTIRIYPKEYVEQRGGTNSLVARTDLEGTYSVLMFDLPGAFSPVDIQSFSEWKQDTADVFIMAQDNINKQEVSKNSSQFDIDGVKVEITFLENEAYAASYILDLQKNSPGLVGEWGSAIAVPTSQIAMVCKISKDKPVDFVKFIQRTKPIVEKHYGQDQQPISDQFFWYYKGRFTKINIATDDKGNIKVFSPFGLTELMTEK
jgi:hypothetical protein